MTPELLAEARAAQRPGPDRFDSFEDWRDIAVEHLGATLETAREAWEHTKPKRRAPQRTESVLDAENVLVLPTPIRTEDWVPDPEFLDYATNVSGEVMRITGGKGAVPGRVLNPTVGWVYLKGKKPYLSCRYRIRVEGKTKWVSHNHFLNNRLKTLGRKPDEEECF